jgi:hypothetical protein
MVKTLVVNFDEEGRFASATKQEHDADGEEGKVPQPNESIELPEAKAILAG